jgi:hypothetical protein
MAERRLGDEVFFMITKTSTALPTGNSGVEISILLPGKTLVLMCKAGCMVIDSSLMSGLSSIYSLILTSLQPSIKIGWFREIQ